MRQFITTLALSLSVVASAQAQDVILRQSGAPDRLIRHDSAAIREQIAKLQNQLREMTTTMQLHVRELPAQIKELQNRQGSIELNIDGLRSKTLALRERDLASQEILAPIMRTLENAVRRRPLLGITVAVEPRETDKYGAYIDAVTPGSPAAKAGILAGDVIVRIGGKSVVEKDVNPGQHLIGLISTLTVGKPVDVELRRGTQNVNVKVTPMEDNSNIAIARTGPGVAEMGRLQTDRIAEGQLFRNISPTMEMNLFSNSPGTFSYSFGNNGLFANIELTSLNEKLGSYFGATEGVLVVNVDVPRDIAFAKLAPSFSARGSAGGGGTMVFRTDSVSRKTPAPAGAMAGGRGGAGAGSMSAPAEPPRVSVRSGRVDSGVTYIDGVLSGGTVTRRAPVNIPVEPGDVIVSVDGRKVSSPSQLMRIVGSYEHNDEFKLQIIRQKRPETLTIKMP